MSEINSHIKRSLNFELNGRSVIGELVIGIPHLCKGNGKADAWACTWSLSETDPVPKNIYGEDALSALTNCLEFLSGYIRDQAEAGLVIWWLEKGDNAGLNFEMAE